MSTTIVPIIIPSAPHEPEKCPHCKQLEDIKTVCGNCGYEYPEDDYEPWSGRKCLAVIVGWVVGLDLVIALLHWSLGSTTESPNGGFYYNRRDYIDAYPFFAYYWKIHLPAIWSILCAVGRWIGHLFV